MRNIQIERIVVNEAADSNISLNETRNTLARFVDDAERFNPPKRNIQRPFAMRTMPSSPVLFFNTV